VRPAVGIAAAVSLVSCATSYSAAAAALPLPTSEATSLGLAHDSSLLLEMIGERVEEKEYMRESERERVNERE
jgi:hypothetical protein